MTTAVRDVRWTLDGPSSGGVVVHAAGNTDTGRVRTHNEDSWLVSPPIFLVADGMGGHAAGDIASALTAQAFEPLAGTVISRDDIDAAFVQSVHDVTRLAVESGGAPGTTLTLLAWVTDEGGRWLVANIGDSRIYRLEDGRLERLTHDHSVVQELVDAGELAEADVHTHPERSVITRSIGAAQSLPPDFTYPDIAAGARVLLCSDGICGEIDDVEIERILSSAGTPADAVDDLLAAANAAGGHDNATAIVLDLVTIYADPTEDTLGRPLSDLTEDTIPGGMRRV